MGILRKLWSKIRASLYVFKKAEIMRNIVNKEINGEYDNLCHMCYFNERYQERARLQGTLEPNRALKLSIYLGGTLGDYIVYLRFVDEISSVCECTVDLFLDRIEFAQFVFGKRNNVTIIHDAENCLFSNSCGQYDMAVHLDHGLTLRHCELGAIREKAPLFYKTACRIVEYSKAHRIDISNQHERETVILRRAKFFGETKWSKLSCGGAVDMSECYSNIVLDQADFPVLSRYGLSGQKYITVNYGADKNMGGTAQTKVLPAKTLEELIALFKEKFPDYLVVQTGVKGSISLMGADKYAFDCRLEETTVLLKYSSCHIDSEGGLVHLASQMSTPCVVSFGPTPVYYYGYERNENIVSPACNDCMSVTGQWSRLCPRGMQVPECMRAITAAMIFDRAEKVLASAEKEPAAQIESGDNILAAVDRFLQERKYMRTCIIGPLNEDTASVARKLKRIGHDVNLYIPLNPDREAVELRTQLKQRGVRVEYGNTLNIAKASHSFDVVLVSDEERSEQFHPYAVQECARLTAEDGQVIWCGSKKTEFSQIASGS